MMFPTWKIRMKHLFWCPECDFPRLSPGTRHIRLLRKLFVSVSVCPIGSHARGEGAAGRRPQSSSGSTAVKRQRWREALGLFLSV